MPGATFHKIVSSLFWIVLREIQNRDRVRKNFITITHGFKCTIKLERRMRAEVEALGEIYLSIDS